MLNLRVFEKGVVNWLVVVSQSQTNYPYLLPVKNKYRFSKYLPKMGFKIEGWVDIESFLNEYRKGLDPSNF